MEHTCNKTSRVDYIRLEKELFALLRKYRINKEDKRVLLHHAFVLVGRQIELQTLMKRVDEALLGSWSPERTARLSASGYL